ncbi:MAG TPA: STAS domain-containing protein [Pirellulales bacterium]|jgi:anti-sigma B factor antagonist|nr:STAS domain-containing protein [Pirellulales bacterium]
MSAYRRIATSVRSGVIIVRFTETKITDPARIEELSRELTQLVDAEHPSKLLLNFDKVDYLSSEALRVFLLLQKKMQSRGGMLKLCNVAPEIFQVFEITGLNKLFDIRPTEVDALSEF